MKQTLESFINFCDDMMIAEEGLFSKKLKFDATLFDLSDIPEDRKADAESIIHDILAHKNKYEELSIESVKKLLKLKKTDKLSVVPVEKVKMNVATSDGDRHIELKNGTKGYLKVNTGDITCGFRLLVKHAYDGAYKTYVKWVFVNNNILTPIWCYTAR